MLELLQQPNIIFALAMIVCIGNCLCWFGYNVLSIVFDLIQMFFDWLPFGIYGKEK